MNIRAGLGDLKNATWTRQKAWIEASAEQKESMTSEAERAMQGLRKLESTPP